MLIKITLSALAFAVGVAFALQAGINAALARQIGSALFAATASFTAGFAALTMLSLANGQLNLSAATVKSVPAWMWVTGGLLGAAIVYTSVSLVPRIGIAALTAFIIAGQLTASAVIDHFGLFGVPVHPVNLVRSIGIALLFAGAILVRGA